MSYGNLGQSRSGHLRGVSKNPKTGGGSSKTPAQGMRGFGGAPSRNTVSRGIRSNAEGQTVRGYPITKSNRRSGGKGR